MKYSLDRRHVDNGPIHTMDLYAKTVQAARPELGQCGPAQRAGVRAGTRSRECVATIVPRTGVKTSKPRLGGRVLSSNSGADEGIRTPDPCFTKALLYP